MIRRFFARSSILTTTSLVCLTMLSACSSPSSELEWRIKGEAVFWVASEYKMDSDGCMKTSIRYEKEKMGTHAYYWWDLLGLKNINSQKTTHYVSYPPPDDWANGEMDNIQRLDGESTYELKFSNSHVYGYQDNVWQNKGVVKAIICTEPGKYVFTISQIINNEVVIYDSPTITIE